MKVLVSCVCYNNLDDAVRFLESLKRGIQRYSGELSVVVSLVNNGAPLEDVTFVERLSEQGFVIDVLDGNGNVGYFPGCYIGYKNYKSKYGFADVVITSNVDLVIDENFFVRLGASCNNKEKKIVAPAIWSLSEKKDRNPKILNRPSELAMKKYWFLYSIPFFHHIYKNSLYKLKRFGRDKSNTLPKPNNKINIYAPHGSIVIFVNIFELCEQFLLYPVFLFGEEIYIGEIARNNSIPVSYENELIVVDSDHASTSLESERFIRRNNFLAIDFLIKKFWA